MLFLPAEISSFLCSAKNFFVRCFLKNSFMTELRNLASDLAQGPKSIMKRDPAARSWATVFFLYPGFRAILLHRIAHILWLVGACFLARMISEVARLCTGIEIHPGAVIGRNLFIDHGMGVVIGETTEIGHNVTLYHGVTLGGVEFEKKKRHPTIKDGAMLFTGATILGAITIGENAKIGAHALVVKDVLPGQTMLGALATRHEKT